MREEPLNGGRNADEVVRAGDTVRRARDRGSASAARLLGYLESAGYPYAPRHLGVDDRGRDILTYIPGRTTDHPSQRADGAYARGAVMFRELHDAYGPVRPETLIDAMIRSQDRIVLHSEQAIRDARYPAAQRASAAEAIRWATADKELIRASEELFLAALR